MEILIVYRGIYPSHTASSKRLANYLKALHYEHHNPIVIPVFIKVKNNYLDFIYSFLIPVLGFFKILRNGGSISVVFVYGPGWIFKLAAVTASKILGKPVATELNEKPYSIHGEGRREKYLKHFRFLNRKCLENIVFPFFDGFLVISEPLVEYVRKLGKNTAVISKIPILVDIDFYQKMIEKPDCHIPYIINTAALNNHKDGIVNVFKAFARVVNSGINLHFYLTSRAAPRLLIDDINNIISINNLEKRVIFLNELDEDALLSYQAYCCMVVLNKVDTEQNRFNFATKLGEYMALGKPIITTSIGEVKHYLKDNVSCLYVDPSNEIEISDAIIRLLKDESLSSMIGDNGRTIAEKQFDVKSQSKRISDFFKRLISWDSMN